MFNSLNHKEEPPGIINIDWKNPASAAYYLLERHKIVRGGDKISIIIYVKEHLAELGSLFFNAAHNSQGKERAIYAKALIELGKLIDQDKYRNQYEDVLRDLMTNHTAIEELIKKGKEEEGEKDVISKIKRHLVKK